MSPNEPDIDVLVKEIVELVHPLRIILFGSRARNEAKSDSDIDLLIVMPEGTHRRKAAQYLYRNIRGIKVPYDLIVATPRDLELHQADIGLIYISVLREGRDVYAA